MNRPADHPQRERFIVELDRNFSVIASAGSGKTRAITDRIATLARSDRAELWLPKMVVVTYTNRAAGEMRQRARQALLDAGAPPAAMNAFGHAFFGTIHSFCLKLLQQHGHFLALPGRLDLLTSADEEKLWRAFLQEQRVFGSALSPTQWRDLLRLIPIQTLLNLGRLNLPSTLCAQTCPESPALDFSSVLACIGKGQSAATIERTKERLRKWLASWPLPESGLLGMPKSDCGAKDFASHWEAAISPLRLWLEDAAMQAGQHLCRAYREYRLARGLTTFDDQISLAGELLRHPEAGPRIRAEQYRILLDEAQDTDPAQFAVLLDLARPAHVHGSWPEDPSHPPEPGRFCMVGDFQQSIYGQRADLKLYRSIHDALVTSGAADELTFSVTFRLDAAILEFVNRTFPQVLDAASGQVPFVQLSPRHGVLPGQVLRLPIAAIGEKVGVNIAMTHEAETLASWLAQTGLEPLRARTWSEVAIICPRTRWLQPIQTALLRAGFDVQVQSDRQIQGVSPAYAWLTALLVVLTRPFAEYETVGVLREVYALSDDALARYSDGRGERFRLSKSANGEVGRVIRDLAALRDRVQTLPVFDAVREIIDATDLRGRLASLPASEYPDLDLILENLLSRAANEEARSVSLAEFAEALHRDFSQTRDPGASRPDAIQLISGHKAKGSEWDCVILPGLWREVSHLPGSYPRLQSGRIIFDGEGDARFKDERNLQKRHETERLLYVAFTRARRTLVLVEDLLLFRPKSGCPAALLSVQQPRQVNAATFAALPTAPVSCPLTASRHAEISLPQGESILPSVPPFSTQFSAEAHARAAVFIKRNPSSLVIEREEPTPSIRGLSKDDAPGALYGSWWHSFIEKIDWRKPGSSWEALFARHLTFSPNPERSQRDWLGFLTHFANANSPWYRALCTPGLRHRVEMPFLWRMNSQECLEGIMDLAIYDPVAASWLVLDWKSNHVAPQDLPHLYRHYLPQLAAYWQALGHMTGLPVRAALYSTACAEWYEYPTSDLQSAWQKLSVNPDELAAAIALS